MPRVNTRVDIPHADADYVWQTIIDSERFPQYMDDVLEVSRTHEEGGWRHTSWKSRMGGIVLSWDQRDLPEHDKQLVTFEQTKGDLKVFRGFWKVHPLAGGEGVSVEMEVEFELGSPALAPFNPFAAALIRANSTKMLEALRRKFAPPEG